MKNFLVATSCRQCRDPLCMVGCPVGAIRRRQSLEVIIEDWCIGCGLCARNCPYGNITLHPFNVTTTDGAGQRAEVVKQKATSCDLCTNQAEPSCVYACPHDAAHRVEPNEFFQQVLKPTANGGMVSPGNCMRIDRTHRPWAITAAVALAISLIAYVLYASGQPGGPRGGTAMGLAFGIAGYALMLFAGLLGARKKCRYGALEELRRGCAGISGLA